MPQDNFEQETPRKSRIPYIFFAFFAVVILVNVVYIYLSKKTWRGVVTQNSYEKGLNYNDTLNEAKKEKDLGWKVEIRYSPLGQLKGEVLINLYEKNMQFISNAEVDITFKRPTQEGYDFSVPVEFKNGVYKAQVQFPMKGQWVFEVVARKGEGMVHEVKRYVIQ